MKIEKSERFNYNSDKYWLLITLLLAISDTKYSKTQNEEIPVKIKV